jgi:hypothetical protein
MNAITAVFILLLALEHPSGPGVPEMLTRFDGPAPIALQAEFVRFPAHASVQAEIEWFLDGGGILAPVGRSSFVYAREQAEEPYRQRGSFPLSLPKVEKPTLFRGVIYAQEEGSPRKQVGTVSLRLIPADTFAPEWQRWAEQGLPLQLAGELGGWRAFLTEQNIAFTEIEESSSTSINRNGLVLADRAELGGPLMDQATKAALFYGAVANHADEILLQKRHADTLLLVGQAAPEDISQDPTSQAMFLRLAETFLQPNDPSQP